MGFNSSGIYTREDGTRTTWHDDAANNVKIEADLHDTHDNDLADALSQTILKDGRSTILANIPFAGKKIVNLGAGAVGSNDAANMANLAALKEFSTGISITGTNANGRITFAGTGVNGLSWGSPISLFWGAKAAKDDEAGRRLVLANTGSPPDTGNANDVLTIDYAGRINNSGILTNNLSLSTNDSKWRTIAFGTGTYIQYTGGNVQFFSNDTATTVDAYVATTLRNYFQAFNSAGSSYLALIKSASAKVSSIRGQVAGERRWEMFLGNSTAESGTAGVGSDFQLQRFNNSGVSLGNALIINRNTAAANFYGNIVTTGSITSGSNFDSTSTTCVVSATNGGSIYLRPDGPTVGTSGFKIDTNGTAYVCEGAAAASGGIRAGRGLQTKAGYQGSYGSNWANFNWVSPDVRVYIDSSYIGDIYWQVASDYRIKKDIAPLPSLWNAIKALKPVSYKHKAFRHIEADDKVRWGFVAHEMQEALGPLAATGVKDDPDPEVVQKPDQWLLITALTKALQEAMTRIEALEAAA